MGVCVCLTETIFLHSHTAEHWEVSLAVSLKWIKHSEDEDLGVFLCLASQRLSGISGRVYLWMCFAGHTPAMLSHQVLHSNSGTACILLLFV